MSSSKEVVAKAPNKGKRKIPIEPITNKTKKQVTFSKRRHGLFKKGTELCLLCGAEVAIITFSGAGKLFPFGHPSVDVVVQRYMNYLNNNRLTCNESNDDGNNNNDHFDKYSQQYKEVLNHIEAEKKVATSNNEINELHGNNDCGFWWDQNVDQLGLVELEQFKVALESLRGAVASRVEQIDRSAMSLVPQGFDFGSKNANVVSFHHQGCDSSAWMDQGMAHGGLYPMSLQTDSFLDMLLKK